MKDKYIYYNNEIKNIIECYNILIDSLKKSITSFESNIICSQTVDKGILEKEVKVANSCIYSLNCISDIVSSKIQKIEGDNNG